MNDYNYFFFLIQLILLVPSFFFYRRILKKTGIASEIKYALVCTILFPIVLTWAFVTINSAYIKPWIRSEKFESSKWINEKMERYCMVNDLVENTILIGKTKNDIIKLLGNTTEDGPCNNCLGYSTNEPDQEFSIDHEVLEINFDIQNKVNSVRKNYW